MLNKQDDIIEKLRALSLSTDEAKLYLELLRGPQTHLRLSSATGVNRTKVYRLADKLEKRSLITTRTDDRGTFLVATDPATLEIELVTQEEKLKSQRTAFDHLMPVLGAIKEGRTTNIIVHTYEGEEGFKQMLWHELKCKSENLIFGSGTIPDLVNNERWAEKHRAMTTEAGYRIRELLNPGEKEFPFTLNAAYMERYIHRIVPRDALQMDNQISIYNDTVAIYHWKDAQKVGVEIINKSYAAMMSQIFENYWQHALPIESSAANTP